MADLSTHLHAVINEGILRGIATAIDAQCYGSAVILIYAGIDAMAFLSLPANQDDVTRGDFTEWVDRYVEMRSTNKLSGLDWYAARCGMLHNYGIYSKLYREGKARPIGYVDDSQDEIMFDDTGETSLAIVSIKGLATAFKNAIERFLDDVLGDSERIDILEKRVNLLVQCSDLPAELRKV